MRCESIVIPGTTKRRPPPWLPESVSKLRERYQQAIEPLIDFEAVQIGTQSPPGFLRNHCLDFSDGIRLIVSRQCWASSQGFVVHVLAMPLENTPYAHKLERFLRRGSAAELGLHFSDRALEHWRDIGDLPWDPKFLGFLLPCVASQWVLLPSIDDALFIA